MKCLMKYQWVKLPRNHLPEGKGNINSISCIRRARTGKQNDRAYITGVL